MKFTNLRIAPVVVIVALSAAAHGAAATLTIDADDAAVRAVEASALSDAAAARVEATIRQVEAVDASRWPVLTAGASYDRFTAVPEFGVQTGDPENPVFVLFPNIQNHYRFDLFISQPIYTGGAIAANRQAARLDQSAATWSQSATALDLAYHGRSLYWTAVAAAAVGDVARAQLERSRRMLDDARALREAGMAVDADVYAAEARFAWAEAEVIRTRNEKMRAEARLRSLLAIPEETDIVLDDAGTRRVPARPPDLRELESEASEGRPELGLVEARIQELGARARAIDAARRPTVAATGQYLLARPNQRYLPPVDEANDSWRVGIATSWQFFDAGRTRSRAAAVEAEQRALEHDLAELQRQVALEVTTARLDLESALESVTSADASATAAGAWEKASSERYAAGLAQMSELLEAQTDVTAAETNRVTTRASAWIAEAALRRAVGR